MSLPRRSREWKKNACSMLIHALLIRNNRFSIATSGAADPLKSPRNRCNHLLPSLVLHVASFLVTIVGRVLCSHDDAMLQRLAVSGPSTRSPATRQWTIMHSRQWRLFCLSTLFFALAQCAKLIKISAVAIIFVGIKCASITIMHDVCLLLTGYSVYTCWDCVVAMVT